MGREISNVSVVGAGVMGRGIAQVFASAGFAVTLVDLSNEALKSAEEQIQNSLNKRVAKNKLSSEQCAQTLERLSYQTKLSVGAENCDLFIEAAPESCELKQSIFRQADQLISPSAYFATNTSSIAVEKVFEGVSGQARCLGLHFFNPVPAMKLLEIVKGEETSAETINMAQDLALKLGKTSIVVKSSPGFATSRLGIWFAFEAMRMLEQGISDVAGIDAAMTLGYGHPMGPLMLSDLVGLDVRHDIGKSLHNQLGDKRYLPPALLRTLVVKGKHGKKSGQGFYDWRGDQATPRSFK